MGPRLKAIHHWMNLNYKALYTIDGTCGEYERCAAQPFQITCNIELGDLLNHSYKCSATGDSFKERFCIPVK